MRRIPGLGMGLYEGRWGQHLGASPAQMWSP